MPCEARASLSGGGGNDDSHLILGGPLAKDGVHLPLDYLPQAILSFIQQAVCDSLVLCSSLPISQEGGNLSNLDLIDGGERLVVGLNRRRINL